MTATALLGFLLISGGPPLVLWCTFIANKSFLTLVGLASSFYWLLVLLVTSLLFRAFVPLPENPVIYVLTLLVVVGIQEVARYGAYLIHQQLLRGLKVLSRQTDAPAISESDKLRLSLAHGMGHAIAQSTFMYFSWVSLSAGKGTLYLDSCPQMSYFLAAGWLTLGFFLLHCCSMVVAFYGMDKKLLKLPTAVAVLHYIAAFTTAFNLIKGACVPVAVLVILEGCVAVVGATLVSLWVSSDRHEAIPTTEPEDI